ncbi:MAG: hypothetical protein GY829_08220 [Gammaproteobacteria bacterium]|nr:hypothetical protein [Gammaproteobacteria bacterium]
MPNVLKTYFIVLSIFACFSAQAQQTFSFTTDSEIYAIGDIHGAFHEVETSLKTLNLIDENNNWIGGNAHFVSLGDLIDRGPQARKLIDLFMKLQQQADEAGGQFHILLGNHEIMNLTGDWRYLSALEIAEFAQDELPEQRMSAYNQYISWHKLSDSENIKNDFNKKYPVGFFAHYFAFGLDGKYGQWLLTLPFIIKINDQLFAHGGISKEIENKDLATVNTSLKSDLISYLKSWNYFVENNQLSFDVALHDRENYIKLLDDSAHKQNFIALQDSVVMSVMSPSWYRGNALCHPYFEEEILSEKLQFWDTTRLWVGHTTTKTKQVQKRLSDQLIMIDTGLLNSHYHGEPWIAKIKNSGAVSFINGLTGKTGEPTIAPKREFRNPYKMTDTELEDFLKTAKVVNKKKTVEGRTNPYKVTLEKDGRKIKGIFKSKDTNKSTKRGGWSKSKENADRYQYELIAYKIDKLLDIGLVPMTVERKVNGRKGTVQLWIKGLITDLQLHDNNIEYDGFCDKKSQVNMMDVFDYLIANKDRNLSNIIYNNNDLQLWFIDHSRSFGTSTRRPKMIKKSNITVTKRFKSALEKITEEDLAELKPWLHKKQIIAIWKRRNKLLEGNF